jgi:phospholipase C
MVSEDRRDFLRTSLLAGGSTAAMSLIPASIRRAIELPANNTTGTIMDVEHVVIHMQENRSFDHYFGTLNGVRGFGDPRVIRLPGGTSVWKQPSREHPDGFVLPYHGDTSTTRSLAVDGSGQSHQENLTILNDGYFDRWGQTHEMSKRMVYYNAQDLNYYYALASAFTVCDQYFCSTLTQTYPNRLHMFSGCNGGGKVGGNPIMSNAGTDETPTSDMADDKPFDAYTWITYAEQLQSAGISWKVYQEYDNFQDNLLALFKSFRNIKDKDSPLYRRGRSWVSEYDSNPANRGRSDGTQLVSTFREDLAKGTLPQVSWIVTAENLSEHPDHVPVRGENITAKLIEALVHYPKIFAKTVFILIYDEIGGMFDHVPPPVPPRDGNDGYSTVSTAGEFKYYTSAQDENRGKFPIGLGMRTPTVIVSPWSRGGWVCSEVFDHISTINFLEARFDVRAENISDWRRVVCGDLTSAFDFKEPNRDWNKLALPDTADYLARIARSSNGCHLAIPAAQEATDQEPVQRRARPIPYEFHVNGYESEDGVFLIHFMNTGTAGAVFQVYDYSDSHSPWKYTIEAGKEYVADHWKSIYPAGTYNLAIHGPSGFFRHFKSEPGTQPSRLRAKTRYDISREALVLTLENISSEPRTVFVEQAEIYRLADGQQRQRSYVLNPGETLHDVWVLSESDNWYDLRMTLQGFDAFLFRYAGHMETGKASMTDPAIGPMRL